MSRQTRRRAQRRTRAGNQKAEERPTPTQPIGNTVTGDLGPEQMVAIARSPQTNSKFLMNLRREALRRIMEKFI